MEGSPGDEEAPKDPAARQLAPGRAGTGLGLQGHQQVLLGGH